MTTTAPAIRAALDADPHLGPHIATIKISSRRKQLGLTIRAGEKGITIHVPSSWSTDATVAVLTKNRHRIGSMLLRAKKLTPDIPVKELVGGEGYLWLGRSNRLRLVENSTDVVRHVNDEGTTTSRGTWAGRWLELDRDSRRHGAKPLIAWYVREGNAWLEAQSRPLWNQMTGGRRPMPSVKAANIGRTRWGVHTGRANPADDEIRIAWQTFQLRPLLVRHVLTHEFVHAMRPGGRSHGHEFWRAFERAEIGARQRQDELTREGATVWMGDIRAATR
ncbi:YgjP-like metallopeptidase domain-containing protein [Streptomyces sp. NPDC059193]|uniref:YgjP-like metallopeptidase domain-containing protein n=1 Tax=Streptomyces sp. NPDC059193 TaxID=3346763 RepID=UPI0036766CBE